MKTNIIISTVIAVIFFSFNLVTAQNQVLSASSESDFIDSNFDFEAIPVASPVDVAPHYRKEVLSVDSENGLLQLNYELSGFNNAATLQIQDFTGRTIKSFVVNTLNASNNKFQIADLLSGTYNYVLIVENQKKLSGEFTLNEY